MKIAAGAAIIRTPQRSVFLAVRGRPWQQEAARLNLSLGHKEGLQVVKLKLPSDAAALTFINLRCCGGRRGSNALQSVIFLPYIFYPRPIGIFNRAHCIWW